MSTVTETLAGKPLSSNPHLLSWVEECAKLCKPDRVVWCDGSEEEKERLTALAVSTNVLIPLNQEKLPGCINPPQPILSCKFSGLSKWGIATLSLPHFGHLGRSHGFLNSFFQNGRANM